MAKLDTDYGSFKQLISVSRIHAVPLYQRRYSWKAKKQVAELWSDVVRLYKEKASTGRVESTHFIGSVVLGETEEKSLGPGTCSVIDGQQRLTTLSLLIAAIRDIAVPEPTDRQAITTNYLVFSDSNELRLVLSQADHDAYEAIVRQRDIELPTSPITQAYSYFKRELLTGIVEESDPDDTSDDAVDTDHLDGEEDGFPAADDLMGGSQDDTDSDLPAAGTNPAWDWQTLLHVVSQDLELVSIVGVPAERAYQIFATLNHGGLRLTQVDLTRNAVFMKLPTRNQEAHAIIWQPMETRLGERSLERFLHSWVVRRGHNVPKKDTYASVLQELKLCGPTELQAFELLSTMAKESFVYQVVSDPVAYESGKLAKEWRVSEDALKHLSFLAAWGNVPAQPLLVEILSRWRSRRISSAVSARLLTFVESLLVRRFIVGIPPNDLRSTLGRLVVQVRSASDAQFEDAIVSALKEGTRRWPSDFDVEDSLVTKPFYRGSGLKQTFMILRGIAEEMEGKECPLIQLGSSASKYSVEHILPQTLGASTWIRDMEAWGDLDPNVTWNTRRHTIGNLTLTAYNSELSNRSFTDKKAWIANKLRLQLSTEILERDTWTKQDIESRSRALAQVAIRIWPIAE